MKKICCLTTTFNRPDMLKILTSSLSRAVSESKDVFVDHFILHDGPAKAISFDKGKRYKAEVAYQNTHLGRDHYNVTLSNLFGMVKNGRYDYYMHLNDDTKVCRKFFSLIPWEAKVNGVSPAIVLVHDERDLHHYNGACYQQVDGLSIMPFEYLKAMNFTCPMGTVTPSSSGAWKAFSDRLLQSIPGVKVLHPSHSLVKHLCITKEDSKMNPRDRGRVSLESLKFMDDSIDAKLEWMSPWRGFHPIPGKEYNGTPVTICENLGNAIMALPAYMLIARTNPYLKVQVCGPLAAVDFYRRVTEYMGGSVKMVDVVDKSTIVLHRRHSICDNEVDCYIDIARSKAHEHTPGNEILKTMPFNPEGVWGDGKNRYDVVLSNGSLGGDAVWLRKRYARWYEVVRELNSQGLRVAQVGWPNEFVLGCDNLTGLSANESFDIIANAKMFLGNDTGFYHFAAAIGKPGVMWAGATACRKIYNPIFHRSILPVYQPCANGACYDNDGTRTKRWKDCESWSCTFSSPNPILKAVEEVWKRLQ